MGVLRLKAQQVSTVEMIRKAVHVGFESRARGKHFVFATGHRRKSSWCVSFHCLPRRSQFLENVETVGPLVLVHPTCGIELLREIRRKRKRVHGCVCTSDKADGIVKLRKMAAMIASFADQ